jgi:NADH:ubiquinone oxidoreductase subunit 3 (subunit A)
MLATDSFDYYAPIGLLLVIGVIFGLSNLYLTHTIDAFTGVIRKGKTKGMVYESGMNPIGSTHRRFNVRFYIVAMTFLVFDVEIVFLYPWATVFPNLATGSEYGTLFLLRMLFFILTSVIAFAYAWRKGVFRYD